MFQKEVGEKIIACLGSKNYSRLSIINKIKIKNIKLFLCVKKLFFSKTKSGLYSY